MSVLTIKKIMDKPLRWACRARCHKLD